ncbi:hypothetical protein ElyMa_005923600 [Elysia marginata]|uniref:ADAMTS cysteine-rich domain-containing protein n=1 Tax=Elysia marginata TaxID=1093978 RepID=A0AAV4G8B5_9GAST|nr:hypothetical protein ElyMa_005923600 [Elysia marginata]
MGQCQVVSIETGPACQSSDQVLTYTLSLESTQAVFQYPWCANQAAEQVLEADNLCDRNRTGKIFGGSTCKAANHRCGKTKEYSQGGVLSMGHFCYFFIVIPLYRLLFYERRSQGNSVLRSSQFLLCR